MLLAILIPLLVTGSAAGVALQMPSPKTTAPEVSQNLMTSTSRLVGAVFSPNGEQIAFSSNQTGHFEIWVINSRGEDATRLTYFNGEAESPEYGGPDGTTIAFLVTTTNGTALWTVSNNGKDLTRLTNDSTQMNVFSWNPNGQTIVYDSRHVGNWIISTVNLQGQNRQLTSSSNNSQDPTWSPTGSYIIYSAGPSGTQNLWRMNSDGSNKIQLTKGAGDNIMPTVNPVNSRIAFLSNNSGVWDVWTVDLNGSEMSDLLGSLYFKVYPNFTMMAARNSTVTWNPNGNIIGFTTSEQNGAQMIITLDTTSYTPVSPDQTLPPPNQLIFSVGFVVNYIEVTSHGVAESISWNTEGTVMLYSMSNGGHWSLVDYNFASVKPQSSYG